jgi:acyl carrier protein
MESEPTDVRRTNAGDGDTLHAGTEQTLAALWSEVLQMQQQPSPIEDFFDLGGSSMSMTMLEFRIAEEFGVELPTGAVLGASTIRELAMLIDSQRPGSDAA